MQKDLVTILPSSTVFDAAVEMKEYHVGSVLVVERRVGRLYVLILNANSSEIRHALATTRLLAKQIVSTGNQMILSQKLGVIALAITPSAQYATTAHTSFLEIGCQAGKISPARIKTTNISAIRRNA